MAQTFVDKFVICDCCDTKKPNCTLGVKYGLYGGEFIAVCDECDKNQDHPFFGEAPQEYMKEYMKGFQCQKNI